MPTVVALVYTALVLTALEYFFLPFRVEARLSEVSVWQVGEISLAAGAIWALATVTAFLLIPAALVRWAEGRPLSEVGFQSGGLRRHLWIYAVLFALMIPAVVLAARRVDFLATYPFVAAARGDWSTFLTWEAVYLLQFFALESFFRGSLLFTLERRFGRHAVFVSAVPYCMIHFHKPWPEAFGALAAGIVLGYLALKLRSFYGGVLLHVAVALSMDLLAVRQAGLW